MMRSPSLFVQVQRLVSRIRGERCLATTFWPQDFRRGEPCTIQGREYLVTRYFHSGDYRFYEVWGRPVATPSASSVSSARLRSTPQR
jgi:hypothetical protein